LLDLTTEAVNALRPSLLAPWKTNFQAPNKVALYLFRDGSWVVENFNDDAVVVELDAAQHHLAPRGWTMQWK
jgi:hypothetical protein